MCVCRRVIVDFVGLRRICPSKMKTTLSLTLALFVIVAEEADVLALPLDLLSSFQSQSVFRPG